MENPCGTGVSWLFEASYWARDWDRIGSLARLNVKFWVKTGSRSWAMAVGAAGRLGGLRRPPSDLSTEEANAITLSVPILSHKKLSVSASARTALSRHSTVHRLRISTGFQHSFESMSSTRDCRCRNIIEFTPSPSLAGAAPSSSHRPSRATGSHPPPRSCRKAAPRAAS